MICILFCNYFNLLTHLIEINHCFLYTCFCHCLLFMVFICFLIFIHPIHLYNLIILQMIILKNYIVQFVIIQLNFKCYKYHSTIIFNNLFVLFFYCIFFTLLPLCIFYTFFLDNHLFKNIILLHHLTYLLILLSFLLYFVNLSFCLFHQCCNFHHPFFILFHINIFDLLINQHKTYYKYLHFYWLIHSIFFRYKYM